MKAHDDTKNNIILIPVGRFSSNVLITGGTDGIGKASAKELVKLGYNVIIIGNTVEKGKAAVDEIKQAMPEGNIQF